VRCLFCSSNSSDGSRQGVINQEARVKFWISFFYSLLLGPGYCSTRYARSQFRDDNVLTCHPGRPSKARSIRDPEANPNLLLLGPGYCSTRYARSQFRDDSVLTCHPGRPSKARSIRDPEANPNLSASGSRILFDSLRSLTVPGRQCFNLSSRKAEQGEVYPGSRS